MECLSLTLIVDILRESWVAHFVSGGVDTVAIVSPTENVGFLESLDNLGTDEVLVLSWLADMVGTLCDSGHFLELISGWQFSCLSDLLRNASLDMSCQSSGLLAPIEVRQTQLSQSIDVPVLLAGQGGISLDGLFGGLTPGESI